MHKQRIHYIILFLDNDNRIPLESFKSQIPLKDMSLYKIAALAEK